MTEEGKRYWLKLADFYLWPHVQYFDSVKDLVSKLKAANFKEIHMLMMEENRKRHEQVDRVWQTIADGIDLEPRQNPTQFFSANTFLPQ